MGGNYAHETPALSYIIYVVVGDDASDGQDNANSAESIVFGWV